MTFLPHAALSPTGEVLHPRSLRSPARRALTLGGLATLTGLLPRKSLATNPPTPADGNSSFWLEPRVIAVRNVETREQGEFMYWRDGQLCMPDYSALCQLCRDHRGNKVAPIAVGVFDLMYATQTWYLGAERKRTYTELTSVNRTPSTNAAVGGSPGSQHLHGKAADGRLVGVTVSVYAAMLLAFRAGGVGLYTNHVHWDVDRPQAFWRGGKLES
ncbi:DUF882 domain-containing protein [Variovorax paradoxus]|uniref:YcbK family protein n=1 Tax=Variovorax paradoxus TaxID=34073 RepID=UPI001ABC86F7